MPTFGDQWLHPGVPSLPLNYRNTSFTVFYYNETLIASHSQFSQPNPNRRTNCCIDHDHTVHPNPTQLINLTHVHLSLTVYN